MNCNKILPALVLSFLLVLTSLSAQTTVVKGMVKDENTKEPLGFALIVYGGTYEGVEVEWDGSFEMSTTNMSYTSIEVGFTGYKTKTVPIEPGKEQELEILLALEGETIKEVIVTGKKAKKDTAAISLFRRIVKAKEKLRESAYDYYYYEDYTKTEFDIFNVNKKLRSRRILKPFDFVFENMDTTENGAPFLPILLKEKISDVYYRKNPKKEKEIIKGDRFTGVDNAEVYALADYSFPDIDIYDKTVVLGGKGFVNPFSQGAQFTYKYFLEDSAMIGDKYCYKLQFTPRRKGDLAFTGDAWVDKKTAAIKSLEIVVLDQINVNFLTGLQIRQDFDDLGDENWFKTYERMEVLMNLSENKDKQAIRVVKTTTYKDIKINEPIEDAILDGDNLEIAENAYEKSDEYWDAERHEKLSENEEAIYATVKKVRKTKAFKIYNYMANTFASGYFNAGKVEFGRFLQFYSFNGLEGNRYRFGMRTSPKYFRDKFVIGGYAAYGDKDKLFKYHIGANMHLKRKNNKWHMVGGHYRYDWSDYNFKNPYMSHDHILSALLRGRNNLLTDLFLIREGYGFYEKEWIKGFTNKFSFKHKRVYSWEDSNYDVTDDPLTPQKFEAVEFAVHTEYGPGQLTVNAQGGADRKTLDISQPVYSLDYTVGVKGVLGGDYAYHTLMGTIKHKITSRVGRTYYILSAAKTWGDIPSPLLTIHKGNRSYLYNQHAFNMMDDLEFVNDAYAFLEARHLFDGFIMNAIPGVRKLKLRTMFYGKGLYGGMTNANKALLDSSPDAALQPLEGFYGEVGVGILNIFKFIELYGFYRVAPEDPTAKSRFGFKFNIGVTL